MYIRSTCTCSPSFFPSCLIRLLDLLLMFIQVYTNGTVYTYHVIAAKEEEEEEIEVWQRAKGKGRMRRKKKINTIVFVVEGCRCVTFYMGLTSTISLRIWLARLSTDLSRVHGEYGLQQ